MNPNTPDDSTGLFSDITHGMLSLAADDIDWAEIFADGPGALWVVPEVEISVEPEIPMPAEVEAAARAADEQLAFMLGLIGLPLDSDIILTACRAVWAHISAAHMAYRRQCAATSGAHTELDYYREDHY